MLSSGDQHAFLHQTGGVADAGQVAARRLDLEVIQIGSPEDNPGSGCGGKDSEMNRSPTVKTNPFALDRRADCLFLSQREG